MRRLSIALSIVGILAATPGAFAQESTKGVIKLREITIVGRIQKPVASVDVNKIQPKLTLAELRQPFLDRIETAIYSAPF